MKLRRNPLLYFFPHFYINPLEEDELSETNGAGVFHSSKKHELTKFSKRSQLSNF